MFAMRVCVSGAQYSFWWSNKFFFLVVGPGSLHFWRRSNINSRCFCRCVLSWEVLFQQREMRISWRLCNNSEIYLWLWKLRSLVVCSKSCFMLQQHVKTTKTDKTCFFFAKKRWPWYPTNNCHLMSHCNQPNTERKN